MAIVAGGLVTLSGCSSSANAPAKSTTPAVAATVAQAATASPRPTDTPAPSPTPTPAPATAGPTPNAAAVILDCGQRLLPSIDEEGKQLQLLGPAFQALGADRFNQALIDTVGNAAAQIAAIDVSLQSVPCDPPAAEFVSLVRAASKANAEGTALAARGARGHDLSLLDAGNQRITEGGALIRRATALLSQSR